MGRPGCKRRLALEDEYWKLMAAGVGTVEACRQLGIGRTTGYYRRSQRGGLVHTVRFTPSSGHRLGRINDPAGRMSPCLGNVGRSRPSTRSRPPTG